MACPEVEIVSDGEWSPLDDDEGEILPSYFPLPSSKKVKEELSDIRCCSKIFSFSFFFFQKKKKMCVFFYYFLPFQKVILRSSIATTPMRIALQQ